MKQIIFTLFSYKEIPAFQKSITLENSIFQPEPQPVKVGVDKFGVCWAGLSWSKSISVGTPSQLHLAGTTLCQAHQLWPIQHILGQSWFIPSFHLS